MASYDCYVVVKHISAQTFSYRGRRVLVADLEAYVHGLANKELNTRGSAVYAVDSWPNDFDPTTLDDEDVREHWNSLTLKEVKQCPRCPGDLKFRDLTKVKALVAVKYVCAAYIFTRNVSTHAYHFTARIELEACLGDEAARVYDLVQKTLQKDATVQVYSTHTWPDTIDPSVDIPLKIEQQWSLLDDQFIRANCASCSEFSDVDIAPRMLFIAVVDDAPPSKTRINSTHENPYSRETIIHKSGHRKSPSQDATTRELRSTQSWSRPDALYNWRPFELSPPPIQIYSPVFAKFTRAMAAEAPDDSTAAELDGALNVIQTSTAIYADQVDRLVNLAPAFEGLPMFLGSPVLYFRTKMEPDGAVFLSEGSETLVAIVQLKNEIGAGDCDPLTQAECTYVNMVTSPAYTHLRKVSCCPVFLVGICGPYLVVGGAVFAHRLVSQRLTDYISLVPLAGECGRSPVETATRRVAKLWRALKTCVGDLKTYYGSLELPADARHRKPSSQPGAEVFIGPYLTTLEAEDGRTVRLTYEAHLAPDYPDKAIFRATMDARHPVVVKFVYGYCGEAHRLLADLAVPLAPRLHHCGPRADAGGLVVVVMDYVEPARDQRFTAAHAQALRTAMKALHAGGLVHGDLRRPNMLLKNAEELMVIDFDWSGREGKVRYPVDVSLRKDMGWHEGVGRGAAIEKAHDEHLVELLGSRVS
ncbi:hypothetical protein PHLGIDRAFT_131192 [Phlebiopsis gigantea 11061_1 CR5-6]|uniref:Uncharacterized protein n=1 Tax=Phlebiopsis gigantea (strain 11061_1 CR5-6) TaxID=745531 RepID=A0A0C3RZ23_PHLG1|nr:hypothetical protein PHLGIDRAFT_131192 [Phlebiopsis gigantea 11061_1 CR5-6]